MKKIIFIILLIFFIAGCTNNISEITNFKQCMEAGNSVMESYPRQCSVNGKTFTEELGKCGNMNISQAIIIAQDSNCTKEGILTDNYMCNENTKTLWIDLTVNGSENCSPACVVDVNSGATTINWRCTGLLQD